MNDKRPNLNDYFYALDTFLLGDIKVFDKNCELADKAKTYYNPDHNTPLKTLLQEDPPPYSSIYANPGSHVMAAYMDNPNPRLTIPLALTLFSAMELLGIFYTGRSDARSTTLNISTFFQKVNAEKRPSEDEKNRLIKTYRHGLAHQYFAKNKSSLSYSFLNPPQLFFGDNNQYLNVNYLKQIFLNGFYVIRDDKDNYLLMEANLSKMLSTTN